MNTKQLIALTAAAFLGQAAIAQEATSDAWTETATSKSRAEVRAELDRARAEGRVVTGGEATLFVDAPVAARRQVQRALPTQARLDARPLGLDIYNVGA